ncbi:hypothetical protein ML462_09200 [Gramella lutea]|uniref:Uncharacterized protein n=1 Tax=Christiangramia lutea TaxID=1607951 RepID=A0A9X1V3E3_9FLAO|nr:hypothetical protein [Christiangramia lutea]MCH4823351.1 hypothetical protein [Christiangramia lutea]
MKRLFFVATLMMLMTACDDGDITVTSFDFEDSNLSFCDGASKNVFYAINSQDVFESFSIEFDSNDLIIENGNPVPPEEGDTIEFTLNNNNRALYRIYNSELPSGNDEYFCSVTPPSSPLVTEEWVSTGGNVLIFTDFGDLGGDMDADGDGLSNIDENYLEEQDTDGDGIPDYLDIDDDGDNVTTRTERATDNDDPLNDDGERDHDEDGIPNYLDDDDDNDGVLTRLEVSEETGLDAPEQFTTAEGISNYLNRLQDDELEHDEYIPHNITRRYRYAVRINDLSMGNPETGETIRFQNYRFGNYGQSSIPFPLCPEQDPNNCGEEDEDDEEETEEPAEETN